jgi:LCP family protein required for cell wall assembly
MLDVDFKRKIEQESLYYKSYRTAKEKLRGRYYVAGFILAMILIFSVTTLIGGDSRESWLSHVPLLGQLLGAAENKPLVGEEDDRINILLLGMGGKNHDGPYLTDTIILASLQPSTKKVVLTAIPRDLLVPNQNGVWQKVNSINAYVEADGEDGSKATAEVLSEVFGTPINYYFRVDFEGFTNIIDELGGVTVTVDNTLDDYQYPILGQEDNPDYYSRYEHLHIDKGVQQMDGELALKYARSRHGVGSEGSDFARSKRQAKIIAAVKDRTLSLSTLMNPARLARIMAQLNEHLSTNIKIWEGIRLWNLFKDVSQEQIIAKAPEVGPGGLLVESRGADGAYILIPRTGNYNAVKEFIQNILGSTAVTVKKTVSNHLEISPEAATIEIRNGTLINGLASQVSAKLKPANFQTIRVANAAKHDLKDTVIYDLTYGAKPQALSALQDNMSAVIGLDLPQWLVDDIKSNSEANPGQARPDFILLLGSNSSK